MSPGTGPERAFEEVSEEASAPTPAGSAFRYLALLSVALAYITILLGADVTVSNNPLVCPTWPGCAPGSPVPALGGPATAEFLHRMGALSLSLVILVMLVVAHATRQATPGTRRLTDLAFLLVLVQAGLGGVIIFSNAAFTAVVLHLGLATFLFAVLVFIAIMASFPHLPPRWQLALLGGLSRQGEGKMELERAGTGRPLGTPETPLGRDGASRGSSTGGP